MAVPEPDEANQTLLIIPVESRQTLQKFVWVLHVSIEDSSSNEKHNHIIEPNPKSLFSYSTQLKPGKYKITKMIRKAKPGFKLGVNKKRRPEKVSNLDDIELKKGGVTILNKKFLFQQPQSKLGNPPKRGQNQQKKTDAERNLERIKRDRERKADQEEMKKQRVRFVQIVDLDESFKTKLLEELKEVENYDTWK
ncbi:MAG: hypothetical protein VYA87_08235 [SAR324 cluster bacterium]|nr:hypothetical protein [SAR324 cluster bacterium]